MWRLGLTGSIAMGKSTAARVFRLLGVPVYDADREIHRLLARGGAGVAPVAERFPQALVDNAIDRQMLGRIVFEDRQALRRLEAILHPLARRREYRFLAAAARRRAPLVVLDIPLLFETGGAARCDAAVVVSAPAFLQRDRALSRRGMSADKFAGILARQMDDREKRRRADFVVTTGLGRRSSLNQLRRIVTMMTRPDWRPKRHRRRATR